MKTTNPGVERRSFLALGIPACAAFCAGMCAPARGAALPQSAPQEAKQAAKHPFDEEVPRKFTYRDMFRMQYGGMIVLGQSLTKTLGREKGLELLTSFSSDFARGQAKGAAQLVGGNDFVALKKLFDPAQYKNQLVMEVVENTERAFQVKVTECLWARTFQEKSAGEEGYAMICHGDYAFATAFNPQVEMVRDKTLMQGHPYCNHRYQWKNLIIQSFSHSIIENPNA